VNKSFKRVFRKSLKVSSRHISLWKVTTKFVFEERYFRTNWWGIWTAFLPRGEGIWTSQSLKVQMPGRLPGGGAWMLKLRFNWYITVVRVENKKLTLQSAVVATLKLRLHCEFFLARELKEGHCIPGGRFWDLWCESKVHRKRTKARLNWLPLFPCGSPAKESRVEKEALEYELGKSVDL